MRLRNLFAPFISLLLPFLFVSCEQEKISEPEEETITLSYSVEEVHIPVNETAVFYLDVTPADRVGDVVVSVSDESVVKFVKEAEVVSEGRKKIELKPVALGSTSVVALLDGVDESVTVIVDPVSVQSVSLNLAQCELPVGGTATLIATVLPADATNAIVAWSVEKKGNEEAVVEVDNGVITAKRAGETVVTATCGEFSATCKVTVHNVYAQSIILDVTSKTIVEGETFYIDATVFPENITFKEVEWTSSNEDVLTLEPFDVKPEDNILSVRVVSQRPGTAVVTAKIDEKTAECSVTVNKLVVEVVNPKVGDYFYSDGSWSDGGLVSINKDGTNPVWAETKPAPIEGKTVIGIVFQTDPDRISDELKNAGYSRGLVMGLCGLYDKSKMNDPKYERLCSYTLDDSFGCIGGSRYTGYRWYNDIKGKYWTDRVVKYYPVLTQCPVFDFAVSDYRLPAPTYTSGWYVPAIGELWDFVANLGGDELARYLLQFRDYGEVFDSGSYDGSQEDFDITRYSSLTVTGEDGKPKKDENGNNIYLYGVKKFSYNPMEKINSAWALVPEDQRDDLFYFYQGKCQFFSSSVYEKGESCCIFTFGNDNSFDFESGWLYGDRMLCHPVLAF